jgi:apolipoprotein N-acyltransferase
MEIVLGILLSATAYFVSTGLGEFWPAAWIAPMPVLVLAFRSSVRVTLAMAFVSYFLGSLNLFSYLTALAPVEVVVGSLLIPAVAFS